MKATVVFIANRGYALLSSREALIRHFLETGWHVVIATADDRESRRLVDIGVYLEPVTFNRGGLAPYADCQAYWRLQSIFRRWHPVLIHQFHAKPVIFGSLAARHVLGSSVRIVNTITGLGHAFITGGVAARLAGIGYRAALTKADSTIFQNRDDRSLFLKNGWLPKDRARLIVGSGINLDRFEQVGRENCSTTEPIVVMIGRLLRQKGIPEFVEVARRIRLDRPEVRFLLAGEEDTTHPDAVSVDWLQKQSEVEYVGRLDNVIPLFTEADLLLFPSYREGVPRVVMEAAATGLPTVAFDVPGVREAVRDGETGFLVPDRDVDALTYRVQKLLADHALRIRMGRAARRLAEKEFDIRVIHTMHLTVYRELVGDII